MHAVPTECCLFRHLYRVVSIEHQVAQESEAQRSLSSAAHLARVTHRSKDRTEAPLQPLARKLPKVGAVPRAQTAPGPQSGRPLQPFARKPAKGCSGSAVATLCPKASKGLQPGGPSQPFARNPQKGCSRAALQPFARKPQKGCSGRRCNPLPENPQRVAAGGVATLCPKTLKGLQSGGRALQPFGRKPPKGCSRVGVATLCPKTPNGLQRGLRLRALRAPRSLFSLCGLRTAFKLAYIYYGDSKL